MRPRLSTLSPSLTTVSFTVTTARPHDTLPTVAFHGLLFLLRMIVGLAACVMIYTKAFESDSTPASLIQIADYVKATPWSYLGPLVSASLFLVFRRFYTGIAHPTALSHCLASLHRVGSFLDTSYCIVYLTPK